MNEQADNPQSAKVLPKAEWKIALFGQSARRHDPINRLRQCACNENMETSSVAA
jgi:hypothetical protein